MNSRKNLAKNNALSLHFAYSVSEKYFAEKIYKVPNYDLKTRFYSE
jgi:hypothetical protein